MLLICVALMITVVTTSCVIRLDGATIEGSGNVITETRDVSGFNEIDLSGNARVDIEVTGTESLTIEAEDNIMPELETVVRGGRLELGTKSNLEPTRVIVYTITAASLDGLTLSGSGAVDATGVDTTDFTTDISGSGSVSVDGAVSGRLSLSISGSGVFDGEALIAVDGRVDVSGSGRAVVNVTDNLFIDLSGSGAIEYIGSPAVESDNSGSGVITQRN